MCGSEVFTVRAVAQVIAMPFHAFGGESGATILRGSTPDVLDPFLGVDAFVMSQPVFAAHPHAGMSAVTLMLPEAKGGFFNRDSLGDFSEINPGDLHWTQAASGMVHDEYPQVNGVASNGLQVFVNLSREHKRAAPASLKAHAADMPTVAVDAVGGQASLRVVAGEFAGQKSPIANDERWLNRVNMLDISMDANTEANLPVPSGYKVFFVLNSGVIDLSGEALRSTPKQGNAIVFDSVGSHIRLQSGDAPVRGVLFTGVPLNEPVYQHGPFTGNTAQDTAGYLQRYQSGGMGRLGER